MKLILESELLTEGKIKNKAKEILYRFSQALATMIRKLRELNDSGWTPAGRDAIKGINGDIKTENKKIVAELRKDEPDKAEISKISKRISILNKEFNAVMRNDVENAKKFNSEYADLVNNS